LKVIEIVDELHEQVEYRKHKPIMKDGLNEDKNLVKIIPKFCDEDQNRDNELIYYQEKETQNMIIKLTHPTDFIKFPLDEEEQYGENENDDKASVIFDKQVEKGKRSLWK